MSGPTLEDLAEVTRMVREAGQLALDAARRLAQWGIDALDDEERGDG